MEQLTKLKFQFFCLKTQGTATISTKNKHFWKSEITVSRAHQNHAFPVLFRDLARAVRPKWWFLIFLKKRNRTVWSSSKHLFFQNFQLFEKNQDFLTDLKETSMPTRFLKTWKYWISWNFESDPGNSEDFKLALNSEKICHPC